MRFFNLAVIVLYCFINVPAIAQGAPEPVRLFHYVFDEFKPGKVQVKSGTSYSQVLNYNIITGEMIFDSGGKYMAIADPQGVDTVFIDGRKFIPLNNKFYEVLTTTKAPLLAEYKATVKEPGASIGYGMSSNTTSSHTLKDMVTSGGAYDLKLPDDFQVTSETIYWILKDGQYKKANTAQQLSKIFPDKKALIAELENKNTTGLTHRQALIQIVQQIQQGE